jgi:outer membrane protein OmpA-like peptidoglycan-associated protein
MSRTTSALLVGIVVVLAAAGGFLAWQQLGELEAQVGELRGSVADLGGELSRSEERAQRAEARVDATSRQLAESEELSRRLAARAEAAESAATSAHQRADEETARAEEAAAAAERAGEASREAEERRQEAILTAERAFLEAERAKREAAALRERRQADLDRLERALDQIADTRRTALGVVMNLGDGIEFDFDRAELRPENRELLARIAGVLMTAEDFGIQVFGHTDDVGSVGYNQQLSERRAAAVRDYLVEAGVDPEVIRSVGFGKSSPLVEGSDPASRQRNRRVEIAVVQTDGELAGDLVAGGDASRR